MLAVCEIRPRALYMQLAPSLCGAEWCSHARHVRDPCSSTQGIPPAGLAKVPAGPLHSFIEQCIAFQPRSRPAALSLLKHPFFDSLREDVLSGSPTHRSIMVGSFSPVASCSNLAALVPSSPRSLRGISQCSFGARPSAASAGGVTAAPGASRGGGSPLAAAKSMGALNVSSGRMAGAGLAKRCPEPGRDGDEDGDEAASSSDDEGGLIKAGGAARMGTRSVCIAQLQRPPAGLGGGISDDDDEVGAPLALINSVSSARRLWLGHWQPVGSQASSVLACLSNCLPAPTCPPALRMASYLSIIAPTMDCQCLNWQDDSDEEVLVPLEDVLLHQEGVEAAEEGILALQQALSLCAAGSCGLSELPPAAALVLLPSGMRGRSSGGGSSASGGAAAPGGAAAEAGPRTSGAGAAPHIGGAGVAAGVFGHRISITSTCSCPDDSLTSSLQRAGSGTVGASQLSRAPSAAATPCGLTIITRVPSMPLPAAVGAPVPVAAAAAAPGSERPLSAPHDAAAGASSCGSDAQQLPGAISSLLRLPSGAVVPLSPLLEKVVTRGHRRNRSDVMLPPLMEQAPQQGDGSCGGTTAGAAGVAASAVGCGLGVLLECASSAAADAGEVTCTAAASATEEGAAANSLCSDLAAADVGLCASALLPGAMGHMLVRRKWARLAGSSIVPHHIRYVTHGSSMHGTLCTAHTHSACGCAAL